jgi:hypothetical protein
MALFDVDKKFEFEVEGHKLAGNFPLPWEERNIAIQVSKRLSGVPLESIPLEVYSYERICCTLNLVITARPEEMKDKDWIEIPDEDFVLKVYNEYSKQLKAFQERLKKNRNTGRDKGTNNRPGDDPKLIPDAGVSYPGKKVYESNA